MVATGRLLSSVLLVPAMLAAGCGSSDNGTVDKPDKTKTVKADGDDKRSTKAGSTNGVGQPSENQAKIYPVEMSEEHAKTCVVKLGDKLPDFTLNDLDGKPNTLSSLLTEKLLVVLMWNSESSQSRNALVHLSFDASKNRPGVRYVAINVGEGANVAKETIDKSKVKFPVLLDADKSLFNKVATDLLPRVYLLNQEGRIVWFNVAFQGPDTRKKLNAAIEYLLSEKNKSE